MINGISFIVLLVALPVAIVVTYLFAPFETIDLSLILELIFSEGTRPDVFAKVKIIYPIIDFLFAIIGLSLLYLNYKHKYQYSVFILCTATIMISLSYYLLGKLYNVFFMLIPSILPIIFYDKKRYYLSFCFLNYGLFVIVTLNLDFSSFPSHLGQPYIKLIGNMSMMYILLFLITNYFKKENKKNENKLKARNDELAAQKEEISRQHQLLEEKNENLKNLAITDQLTELYNRTKIDEELELAVQKFKRYQNSFSLVMIDIDHFKSINDQFGHQTGDKVIKEFANYLQQRTRAVDISGRWGGEEFLIICPETKLEGVLELGEDIRQEVAQKDFSIPQQVTVSIGVAEYKGKETIEQLLHRVDQKLYQAKEAGRDRVVF